MKQTLICSAVSMALAAAHGHAAAQAVPAQPPADKAADASDSAAKADSQKLESVVITGFRASLEKSMALKQQAIGVRDSIVAEDIGKFPEANVAESLQRVPGVILNRDESSGEGQRISIRGLPTEYTVTTLNGALVNTVSTGSIGTAVRGFNYDVFASELFGRVDFYKSPLAELNEGGMGGVVDLQTPRPFDNPKRTVRYGVTASYNSMSGKTDPTGFALVSNTWGDWGALVGVSHAESVNNRSGFEATGGYNSSARASQSPVKGNFAFALDYDSPRANLGSYTRAQVDNALLPRIYRFYGSSNDRTRDGLVGSLQYKTPTLNLSLDTLYSQLKNSRDEMYFGLLIRNSRTTDRTKPAGQTGNSGFIPLDVKIDPASNLLTGTFGNTSYSSGVTYTEDETKFGYVAANGRWTVNDRLVLSGQLSTNNSKALSYQDTLSGQIFGVDSTIDYGSDHVYPSLSSPVSYTDPNNFQGFGIGTGWTRETDKSNQGRIVADWDYALGGDWTGHLKAGLSYAETSKEINKRNGTSAATAKLNTLGTAGLRLGMTSVLPIGHLDMGAGWPHAWGTFTRAYTYSTFDPLALNSESTFTPAQSFKAQENVSTAFVQSDFRGEVLGRELRLNAGVRFARTDTRIDNYKQQGTSLTYGPNQEKGSYTNLLPAFSSALDLTDNLTWRVSWGKTLSRQSLSIIAAQTVIPNPFDNTATAGNPSLRPQKSKNLDTGLEWYFAKGSMLSAALFRKELTDATVSNTVQTTFGALGLPDTALGAIFQDANGKVDPNLPMNLKTYSNAGKQTLKGFELAWQQPFTFLPEPFKGLGGLASYTHINPFNKWVSNAGTVLDVNSVPKYAYSATLYYENGPLAFRTSYNYKGRWLHKDTLSNLGDDMLRWQAGRGYLDANVSYKISDALEVRLEALNLSNTLSYDYFEDATGQYGKGDKTRMDYAKYDGRTFKIGLRGKF